MAHRVFVRIGRLVYARRSHRAAQIASCVRLVSDPVELAARAAQAPVTAGERQRRLPIVVTCRLLRPVRRGSRSASVSGPVAGLAPHRRLRGRRAAAISGLGLAIAAGSSGPAWAANTVNYTFHVPASVQTNPCFYGDVLNLSGDIHIVITTTASNGGYHVDDHLNSLLSGVSITTGTKYVNSEDQDQSWFTGAPFPAIHTETHDFDLLSQSGTPNYVLHLTMHTTVTAQGVPAAVVDNYRMDCTG